MLVERATEYFAFGRYLRPLVQYSHHGGQAARDPIVDRELLNQSLGVEAERFRAGKRVLIQSLAPKFDRLFIVRVSVILVVVGR